MSKVIEIVKEHINPIIEKLGYEVVDIEYKKEYDTMALTFYIFSNNGISLDDCEKVHHAITDKIDEINPTGDEPYNLNISSPGLDRPFKTQRDYERNYNSEVEVKLFAPLKGEKIYDGILVQKTDNVVIVKVNGSDISFELNKVVFVRPLVKFE